MLTHKHASLRDFRLQTQHFVADRDEQVAKASKALDKTNAARLARANVASCQARLEEVMNGLVRLRKENEKSTCIGAYNTLTSILYLLPLSLQNGNGSGLYAKTSPHVVGRYPRPSFSHLRRLITRAQGKRRN
jgi:hypothetical protein